MLACYYSHFRKTQQNLICCLEFALKYLSTVVIVNLFGSALYFSAMVIVDLFVSVLNLLIIMAKWPIFGLKWPILRLMRLLSPGQRESLNPFNLYLV